MMDDIWIGVIKMLKVYLSRLLTKEDFRKAVKERWTAERSIRVRGEDEDVDSCPVSQGLGRDQDHQ